MIVWVPMGRLTIVAHSLNIIKHCFKHHETVIKHWETLINIVKLLRLQSIDSNTHRSMQLYGLSGHSLVISAIGSLRKKTVFTLRPWSDKTSAGNQHLKNSGTSLQLLVTHHTTPASGRRRCFWQITKASGSPPAFTVALPATVFLIIFYL